MGPNVWRRFDSHRLSVTSATTDGSLLDFGRRIREQELPRSAGPHRPFEQRPSTSLHFEVDLGGQVRGRSARPFDKSTVSNPGILRREPVHRAKSLGHGLLALSLLSARSCLFSQASLSFSPSLLYRHDFVWVSAKRFNVLWKVHETDIWPLRPAHTRRQGVPAHSRFTSSLTAHHCDGTQHRKYGNAPDLQVDVLSSPIFGDHSLSRFLDPCSSRHRGCLWRRARLVDVLELVKGRKEQSRRLCWTRRSRRPTTSIHLPH